MYICIPGIYSYITYYIYHLLCICMSYIYIYIMPTDGLLIILDAQLSSHHGYGPGTRAQGPKAAGPQGLAQQLLGLGPVPISIMGEHMCIKGFQNAFNRQIIIGK